MPLFHYLCFKVEHSSPLLVFLALSPPVTMYITAPVTQNDVIQIFHVYIYIFAHFSSLFSADTDTLVKTVFLSVLTAGFWMTTSHLSGEFFW